MFKYKNDVSIANCHEAMSNKNGRFPEILNLKHSEVKFIKKKNISEDQLSDCFSHFHSIKPTPRLVLMFKRTTRKGIKLRGWSYGLGVQVGS